MSKKILFTLIFVSAILVAVNIYSISMLLFARPAPCAKIRIAAVDIADNKPIHDACVCIPQLNAYFYTDNKGCTPLIDVPVIPDNYYDNIYTRNFGEIMVIVYKEGYADYILLNLNIRENEMRQDIKLYLYKKESTQRQFVSIVETPDENWIKNVIEKYRKKPAM